MVAPTYLRSLQALEMAVREGSFTAAAERLGITAAAAGQRVKALEDFLGVELLVRGRGGIRPAPALEQALPHLRLGFAELEEAARELEVQRSRDLYIAAVSDFVDLWLAPRLEAFRAAYPHLRVSINGEGDAPPRLGRADCEISFGPAPGGELSDPLFRDYVLPVTSPVNLARTAGLAARDRLEGFPLLHLDFYKDDPAGLAWPDWVTANAVARSAPERGMRFQRIAATLDAVAADAGVTLGGLALLRERLEAGDIGLPYPVETGRWSEWAFVARYRADAVGREHVQRFRAWLAREAAETEAWLAGVVGRGMREGIRVEPAT